MRGRSAEDEADSAGALRDAKVPLHDGSYKNRYDVRGKPSTHLFTVELGRAFGLSSACAMQFGTAVTARHDAASRLSI
jgi:hypothetical protein